MSSYNKRVFKSCIQNFFKAIAKTLAGIKSFLNVFKDTHRGKHLQVNPQHLKNV